MDYVIIGNSAAAVGAIEAIRKVDRKNPIYLVSDEPYPAYSRPLISYYLSGKVTDSKMLYRPKDFYRENKVGAILGRKAITVDTKKRDVVLEDKKRISFDRLLIATGGAPFIPPIKGLEGEGVHTFTKWDDAKRVAKVARRAEQVVVIGGGLIGLKAAEGFIDLGIKVTVVELAERILSTILDEKGSKIFTDHLKELGAEIVTENTVTEIVRKDSVLQGVRLKDGREIPADMVVVAIGVVPNTEVVKGTDIEVKRGIVVDQTMQTTVDGIYAAGDVVETYDVLLKTRKPAPIWPNAYEQGQIAGYNMAGQKRTYPGSFGMNSLEVCGLPTITVGMFDPKGDKYHTITKSNLKEKIYKKIVLDDDHVVGGIFVGEIDRAGIITGLIKDRIKVKTFRQYLLSDDFGYAVFPEKVRKERLLK